MPTRATWGAARRKSLILGPGRAGRAVNRATESRELANLGAFRFAYLNTLNQTGVDGQSCVLVLDGNLASVFGCGAAVLLMRA
jgi:hypothetical protein